jgi:hypothetical protein
MQTNRTAPMTDLTVANEILRQLGGHRFICMTGAHSLVGDATSLRFSIPGRMTANKANKVVVSLENDLYTLTFYRLHGLKQALVGEQAGVYADQLRAVFTAATGLETSLGDMKGAR